MIKVEHTNKTFSGKYGEVHALQDVSIHVEKRRYLWNHRIFRSRKINASAAGERTGDPGQWNSHGT